MGRYRDTMKEVEQKAAGPHPVWRGIGCGLMILVPIISFTLASMTIPIFIKQGWVPQQLLFSPAIPTWLWYSPVVAQIVQDLFLRPNIFAIVLLAIIYIIILGGIFSVIYAIMYQTVAPPRYGPMDAPPPKAKIRKYRR